MTSESVINPSILIIGAGASGIAAATKLLENGFQNVTILEAENRIGGRICSVPFGDTIVDIGGQWVHGEEGNIVYEMVKDLDLISPSKLPEDPGMNFFLPDGNFADKTLTDKLFNLAIAVKDDKDQAKLHGGSFDAYFTHEFDKMRTASRFNRRVNRELKQNDSKALELAKQVESWFKKFMVLLNPAEDWSKLSTTSHYVFRPCQGHQMYGWKDKGYKTIIDVMTKRIPNPSKRIPIEDKVLLNKEVTKIRWKSTENQKVNVECHDGFTYVVDHVIVTVSVGVLKHIYEKTFEPALPDYKINSIEGIPLGIVNKLLLKFPKRWWPDTVKDISFLWSEEQKQELLREFPYGPILNGRSWIENIFSFIAIDSHPNILLCWINGPTARLVEELPDEIITKGAMFMLRKFAGKQFDIPEPETILRSKWGGNPHFRGSYVYVSEEMEKRGASAEDLTKPLLVDDKPAILFAGEATHGYLFSTVNGAMETGYREADRLIQFYSQ